MANKVTGKTDVTGALSTAPITPKSLIIVGAFTATDDIQSSTKDAGKIFSISGTNDATSAFGGEIASKIVRVLIANGVNNIKGIISTADNLADTLEATLADKTIKVVLCLDNTTATISAVKDHLAMAESNDRFRYSVFAPSATDTVDQTKLIAFAKTISSDRIFVPGPALFESDGTTNAEPQVVAAGIASAIMTETSDPALPMNGVALAGFGGVSRVMLDAEMSALVNAGVTPIYPEGTTPAIHRLVTSAVKADGTADAVWQEGTTRFIADYVLESNSELLRANYKRTKNVARILDSIKGDIQINMEKMVAAEIIENWDANTLTVVKDPADNYGALVDYEFDVVTPLYTITINQHLKI